MRRVLLSPRWLAGHVVVAACVLAFCWLGWWQWERAQQVGGSAQNLGYALQWPLFAAFALFAWTKTIRLELDRSSSASPEPARSEQAPPEQTPSRAEPADALSAGWRRERVSRPAEPSRTTPGRAGRGSSGLGGALPTGHADHALPAGPVRAMPVGPEDEELAAYNRYLAELDREDRRG